ncbi:conserved hypothetical protein [Nitrobacter hamburgensis X14]|uniref:DUF2946 domain-containing protein n=1 Tax=Nitrobacter hamburgensis (strain DSM 10229 / NCIMB 13809 / X14) TaxID=323097 RepID=Q1QIF7_NITHX|nr:DUF2946 domain-containing protein [Nitrobacter hamburgensis]ABE63990.1 conserved hypothetical protein [Nitrobacter hamburgensis X14]
MKWFRSNIKHGSRIALLALAIQFVLSFGHHHGAAALAAPAVSAQASDTGKTQTKPLATKDAAVRNFAKAAATSPAGPASGHDQDSDYCAVCAVMALASTVLFTEPPVLLLPEAYHFLYRATDAEFNHLESRRVVFQPRAPPAS